MYMVVLNPGSDFYTGSGEIKSYLVVLFRPVYSHANNKVSLHLLGITSQGM